MKKIIISISVIVLLLIAALAGATIAYAKTPENGSNTLPDNITINGVDCSGLNYEQAAEKLTTSWNSRHIIVTGSLHEELGNFTDFGYTYDIESQLKKIRKRNLMFSAINHFIKTPLNVNIPMIVTGHDESFREEVMNAPFLNNENSTESQAAYVDLSDPNFPIIPEVYGTKADGEKFFDDLTHQIQIGELTMFFDEKSYYSMPEITADDKNLKKYQAYCKEYLGQKITYELGENTFTLTPEQLNALMLDDMSGNADEAAVQAYVEALAAEYDNIGVNRRFTSFTGREVEVSGGLYGWKIDKVAEAEQLMADINSHQDVSRNPVFSVEGYGEYAKVMGDTYIDVDVSNQVVNMYVNGGLVFSCPCVTGCWANGTLTDIGTFLILNKVQNAILRGYNIDGTEYESPVAYWMGINYVGEGLHDASWNPTFGGDYWRYNGSHGCINIPPSRMPELYSLASVGMPVIVHY